MSGRRRARPRRAAAAGTAVALALALCAVAASGPAAGADTGARSDPLGDDHPAEGPSVPFTDIRKIKHGHTKGGKLRHVVFVRNANRATKALTRLEVRAGGKLFLLSTDGVERFRAAGRLGAAAGRRELKVKRRANKIIFVFSPKAIGDPRRYRWAATIGSNDTSPLDFDRAPDVAGMVKHDLRGG